MIALDTSFVVRLLVEDDAQQTAAAVELVRRARDDGARLFVADIVVCELVWVLRRAYGWRKSRIVRALEALASAAQAEFESEARFIAAIDAFRSGDGDFADHLIRERSAEARCRAAATFDGALLGVAGFVPVDPGKWPDGLSVRETAPRYRPRRVRRRG